MSYTIKHGWPQRDSDLERIDANAWAAAVASVGQMFVGCGIAVAITLLRIITTTPISEK